MPRLWHVSTNGGHQASNSLGGKGESHPGLDRMPCFCPVHGPHFRRGKLSGGFPQPQAVSSGSQVVSPPGSVQSALLMVGHTRRGSLSFQIQCKAGQVPDQGSPGICSGYPDGTLRLVFPDLCLHSNTDSFAPVNTGFGWWEHQLFWLLQIGLRACDMLT